MNPKASGRKEEILRHTAQYAGANYIAQAIGIVNSIVLRRFMGPAAMGIWSVLQVILSYCGYANLGATKALMRDYPRLRGKGENDKAEGLKDMILTFSMLMSLIPAFVIVFYLGRRWDSLEGPLRYGLIFIAAFLFLQRFYDLILGLLRAEKQFSVVSMVVIINAAGMLAVSIVLVRFWNIYGLLAGTALVTLGCLAYIYATHPYRFKFFWNTGQLLQELKLGIPLSVIIFLINFLKSMDRLIIARFLGFHDVGVFSIAIMVSTYLFTLPTLFSQVWYPHLQEEYGKNEKAVEVKNYLLKPVLALSVITPFSCGLATIVLPVLCEYLLPKFLPGIPAMKIYLAGAFFIMMGQFSINFLVTLDKYLISIPLVIAAIALNAILNLWLLPAGINGVAWGSVWSFAFYGILSYALAMHHFERRPAVCKTILRDLMVYLSYYGAVFAIDYSISFENLWCTACVKLLAHGAVSAGYFYYLEKKTGLLRHFLQKLPIKFKTMRA